MIIAGIVGLIAQYYSFSNRLQFAYGDSYRRLDISRKIYDSLSPGILQQIGTVWLPIPTIINIPFVYIDYLWYSGTGAALINFFFFVLNAVVIFKLLKNLTSDPFVTWFGFLLFTFNPNILYFQSSGMSENLFIFFITCSVYLMVRWKKNNDDEYLIFAGIMASLAAGTRYEGWFFSFFAVVIIIAHCYIFRKKYLINLFSFSIFTGALVFSWFLFNYLYYGDILSFQRGQFSSELIAKDIEKSGGLFAKDNINLSISTTLEAIALNSTYFISWISVIGMLFYLSIKNIKKNSLFVFLLLSTIPLTIFSLYKGQIFIILPGSPVYGYLNSRYGLYLLPAVCVFASFFVLYISKFFKLNRALKSVFILIIFSFYLYDNYYGFPMNSPGFYEASSLKYAEQRYLRLADYMESNYKGGKVLIANNEINLMPDARIGMIDRYYVFDTKGFVDTLWNNYKDIKWILFMDESKVKYTAGGTVNDIPAPLKDKFKFEYYDQGIYVYKSVDFKEN
ncbi:MAG TPA: phospholipid carrier-dependent glycosyltransferase [Ignavibacteria bacterium]|nr:phospholipid carrier-dependent glycosyltransferase [Ignavibacteria bacterium]